jgi:hypothetical protein
MKILITIVLLGTLQIPQFAIAIDFNKPSTEKVGTASNDALMQTISKETLFDMLCEKAEMIQNNLKPTASGSPASAHIMSVGYTYTPAELPPPSRSNNSPGKRAPATNGVDAAKARRAFNSLAGNFLVFSGTVCIMEPSMNKVQPQVCSSMIPPYIDGRTFVTTAFFNSYGKDLQKDKECEDAPDRIVSGYAAIVGYYADKNQANENRAIQAVEQARKLPNKCREKVVDFLTYADKRFGKCIR